MGRRFGSGGSGGRGEKMQHTESCVDNAPKRGKKKRPKIKT